VEKAVDKVIQFGLEVWESAERESVDRNRMTQIRERRRCC